MYVSKCMNFATVAQTLQALILGNIPEITEQLHVFLRPHKFSSFVACDNAELSYLLRSKPERTASCLKTVTLACSFTLKSYYADMECHFPDIKPASVLLVSSRL